MTLRRKTDEAKSERCTMYQLIIKNGIIPDSKNYIFWKADVAVVDEKIAGVGQYEDAVVIIVVDAAQCLVTPGLIDHHAHLYPLTNIGIRAEAVCFSSGVTTAVDAGSTGSRTFLEYLSFTDNSKLTTHAYLNVCSTGLS